MRISDWSSDVCSSDLILIIIVTEVDGCVSDIPGREDGGCRRLMVDLLAAPSEPDAALFTQRCKDSHGQATFGAGFRARRRSDTVRYDDKTAQKPSSKAFEKRNHAFTTPNTE